MLYHRAAHIRRRRSPSAHWLAAAVVLLTAACATRAPAPPAPLYLAAHVPFKAHASKARVQVMEPVLAERIDAIAQQSPTFRAAWDLIRGSGVPLRVGTYQQLRGELPRWFREHPTQWAGVTVTHSNARAVVSGAVVAVRVSQIRELARRLPAGNNYVIEELDRVLIHEIYGHLTPIIASGDPRQECPDQLRPGERTPCVQLREREIAAELADHRLARARASK